MIFIMFTLVDNKMTLLTFIKSFWIFLFKYFLFRNYINFQLMHLKLGKLITQWCFEKKKFTKFKSGLNWSL